MFGICLAIPFLPQWSSGEAASAWRCSCKITGGRIWNGPVKEKKMNSEGYRDFSEVAGVTEVTRKECLGSRVQAGMGCYDHPRAWSHYSRKCNEHSPGWVKTMAEAVCPKWKFWRDLGSSRMWKNGKDILGFSFKLLLFFIVQPK